MRFRGRLLTRATLLAALLLGATLITSDSSARQSNRPGRFDEIAGLRPEVRLRKLHLVRPDLIPYPIEYEYYC